MAKVLKDGFVGVRGARQNNLRNIDVDLPRNAFVAFTGVSGSGKSSIAFGTIYAEAQRRYFESVAPYARRLITQLPAPHVNEITGLPPAVALQQRRGEPTARSTVGTLTTISNLLRMLFSRAGNYPKGAAVLDSDAFSPNNPEGACPTCYGMGVVHTVSEDSLVPDSTLSIREGAVAAWPGAWQGKNYRDILDALGYDVDKPWKDLRAKDRKWILFTDEKPVVTVQAQREAHRIQRPYQGTYMSASAYVRHTFATTESPTLRKRVLKFMDRADCSDCNGKRLKAESLAVKFAGCDIAELSEMPLFELGALLRKAHDENSNKSSNSDKATVKAEATCLITGDLVARIDLIRELGLEYLSLDRSVQTLSAGELQRLRLTNQLRSGLFGVIYVLDEPSAGLHPADMEALFAVLNKLKDSGNTLFVVEHEMDLVRQADWVVDIGPGAGEGGGTLLYSGPVQGLSGVEDSATRRFLFDDNCTNKILDHKRRKPSAWLSLQGVSKHNLNNLDVDIPLAVLTSVSGVSGSGKSTLIGQVLADAVKERLGVKTQEAEEEEDTSEESEEYQSNGKELVSLAGIDSIKRLVCVDQKPIGRTPRSNLATYTGLFDSIRKCFAATAEAKKRGYNAGRFSFNVAGGRCTTCEGEGQVSIELLFLPSVYAPCSACHGDRYNAETLEVTYRKKNIAQVLDMTVNAACDFFRELPSAYRALETLQSVGLGYLHLGQPATELSGGEAQRIKLATELQREQHGETIYILDEPTTGLHPQDVEKLMLLLHALVESGNTVIVVEHDMDVLTRSDWIIDLGPGAGSKGGLVIAAGTPDKVAKSRQSCTAPYLARHLKQGVNR